MKKENFLKNLRKHNHRALDYVFEAYGNLIFKVAYSVLNNRDISEECVNDDSNNTMANFEFKDNFDISYSEFK